MKPLFFFLGCLGYALISQAAVAVGSTKQMKGPQRVMTLAPNLTEFVFEVGAGHTLVGTVDTSNYPEAAKKVPRVGDYQHLDVERIVSLKPDLILVWRHGNSSREVAQLEAMGLRLVFLEPQRLEDIPLTLAKVGALLGKEAQAQARANELQSELTALRARYANAASVNVFFQVWSQPLMTVNTQHFISDMLALCGGKNLFGALPTLVPQLSVEAVVAANPEVMLTTRVSQLNDSAWQRDPRDASFAMWQPFSKLTAVQRRWMYTLSADLISRQGPRMIQGAQAVCAAFDQVRLERSFQNTPEQKAPVPQ